MNMMVLPGFGGHLIRGDDGLGGDDHDSEETEVFEGVQARNGQAGQGGTALDSIGEVARDLDLSESALRNWVRQFDVVAGVREGVSTGELEELRRLRSENRQLRMERDILE